MSDRSAADPDRILSTVRRLKLLVAVLIASNIVLGIFAFYFLRNIDRRYSMLIDQSVPSLNELQTLTAVSMSAMRGTNPVLFEDPGENRASVLEHSRKALQQDRDLRNQALERPWLKAHLEERRTFHEAGENFTQAAEHVLQLFESGETQRAAREREETLRPGFDRYVAVTTETADHLEQQSMDDSSGLTVKTGRLSTMLLGIGGWPLALMGVFLLLCSLFVIGVLACEFLLRKAELG